MNYGLDAEDLAFNIDDLYPYTQYGYSFKQEGNKTYIFYQDRILSIVDNDTKLGDVMDIMDNSYYTTPQFANDSTNQEILGNFVSEIESTTGRQVESVTFGEDGYELVVDGEKVTIPYTESGSVSIDDVTSRVSTKVTYKASDPLDENNKAVIENYLAENLSGDYEYKVVLNEDGVYEIQINGETFTVLKEGATLADAVQAVSDEFNSGKSLSDFSPDTTSNRLRAETGQNYKVHIDVEAFEDVKTHHEKALTIMDGCKGTYKVNFTDKLATFYESIASSNAEADPTKRIDKSVELLNNITINVKYSLMAYENIDHNLGMIFNSVVSEIFTMNDYVDPETREFYEEDMTWEDRQIYLEDLIDNYTEQLDQLKAEYEEKYGHGVFMGADEADFVIAVAYGLGLDQFNYSNGWGDEGCYMNLDNLESVVSYIKENDVMTKLKAYSEGASWHDSGMYLLNDQIGRGMYPTSNNGEYDIYYENQFLSGYLTASDISFLNDIENKYGKRYYDLINEDDNFDISWEVRQRLKQQFTITKTVVDGNEEEHTYNPLELVDFYINDRAEMNESINSLANTIYNYNQYKGLMPYEAEMQGEEYLNYLVQDYSNLAGNDKLRYLDQRELALYQMYKGTGQEDKANEYLGAMEDLINQRQGFEWAAERIMSYGGIDGFLRSGWDGLKDGFESFFDGIANCFAADGKRDASDYRDMFMLSILGEENIYTEGLSDANRYALKMNYGIMKSIGQQAIPTLAAFIPGVGSYVSMGLSFMSSFGNSVEGAMQNGASSAQAYLYGALSGVSTVVLNRCLSGIAGLNGSTEALESVSGYLKSLPQQAVRTLLGTYLDGGIRSVVLGEPFDIGKLTEQGFEAAIQGAFTAAIMNGTNKVVLKIANGVTIAVTGSTYKEFCANVEEKMWNSSAGQKVKALFAAGGKKWEQYKANHPNSLLVNMVETYQYNHSADMPISIDSETAAKMGITLKDGETLVYDPNGNNYQRVDAKGNHYIIPASSIEDYEGGMYVELTVGEKYALRHRQDGTMSAEDRFAMADQIDNYVAKVKQKHISDSMWSQAEAAAAMDYESSHPGQSFYDLERDERNALTNSNLTANEGMYREIATANSDAYGKIAEDTVIGILTQESQGVFKPGVTAEIVLDDVINRTGTDVTTFYTDEYIAAWRAQFNPDSSGKVKVYVFQDQGKDTNTFAMNSDSGAFGPSGPQGGMFATSSAEYEAMRAKHYDPATGTWDLDGLTQDLGGKSFPTGEVAVIEVEMPISSLSMPRSNNYGAFYGEFIPGGYTSGGKVEGIIPGFNIDSIPDDFTVTINPGTDQEIGGAIW